MPDQRAEHRSHTQRRITVPRLLPLTVLKPLQPRRARIPLVVEPATRGRKGLRVRLPLRAAPGQVASEGPWDVLGLVEEQFRQRPQHEGVDLPVICLD